jgi:hypothetical protein
VEVLGDEPGDVPLGRVDLRGLPFLIGPEPPSAERCFLLPSAPTSVAIGRVARRVIVAHQGPSAVPRRHRHQRPQPSAFRGRMGSSRGAPDGASYGNGPPDTTYGAGKTPYPERPVEQLELIPRGGPFVVAGITTSNLDEYPFVRAPARPVRLVANDGRNGVFDVDVDRGVATYPQPLPGADDRASWGAAEGTSGRPTISPGWNGRSPRPCARWKSTAAHSRLQYDADSNTFMRKPAYR